MLLIGLDRHLSRASDFGVSEDLLHVTESGLSGSTDSVILDTSSRLQIVDFHLSGHFESSVKRAYSPVYIANHDDVTFLGRPFEIDQ